MNQHDPPTRAITKRGIIPTVLLCALVLVGLAVVLNVDLVDDSYIFLRYARNIDQGHGAVFNIGERVEGYSSPLWTAILATAGLVSPDYEATAYLLGLTIGIGIVWLVVGHLSKTNLSKVELLAAGLGLASCPVLVFWSGSGMDTTLFVFLTTASLLSILKDSEQGSLSLRSAALLTLTTLARMEGVMLAGFAGLLFLCQRRSIRVLFAYGAAMAGFMLVRFWYYDSWVPNTYHAKVTFGLFHRLINGATYMLPAIKSNFLLIALLVIAFAAAVRRTHRPSFAMVGIGGWMLLWCSYVLYVGGDNFALFRFLLPVVPAGFLLIGRCWSSIRSDFSPASRRWVLAGFATVLALSNGLTLKAQAQGYWGDAALARAWKGVGQWLDEELPPDTLMATVVPGALGYFSSLNTIDMLGLTDRNVSVDGNIYAQGGHGHSRYHTDYIFDRNPDIIVYHSSGRFNVPVYEDPKRIHLISGYALYDFATDPRCAKRYDYTTRRLANGKLVEMLVRKTPDLIAIR